MGRFTTWMAALVRMALVGMVSVVCLVGVANATQPDTLGDPVDWDVLPNGWIEIHFGRTDGGVPGSVAWHQVVWSRWTTQSLQELEDQARADGQWVFIVEYDQDRYMYVTRAEPLLVGDDAQQDGRWTAQPAAALCPTCAGSIAPRGKP